MRALSDEPLPIGAGLSGLETRRGRSSARPGRLGPARLSVLDERQLVAAARVDADAFAELYRRHVARIHAYALRRSGSIAVADDVTSATFEKALRGLDRYRWRPPGIAPWLFRIAAHELVDVHRRSGRQRDTARRVHGEHAGGVNRSLPVEFDAVDARSDADELRAALGRIAPRYQRALTLRYLADLSNEEAAAAMGVTRSTMAVVVHRAVASLRRAIEAERRHASDRVEGDGRG